MSEPVPEIEQEPQRLTGGYQKCANELTTIAGRPIGRQAVYMAWRRRASSGFPEGWDRPSYNGATGIRTFFVDDVITWWITKYRRPEDSATG